MATIDEDNDIYNGGGGGGGAVETGTFLEGDGTVENPVDVKPLPTETFTELNNALMDCLSMVKIAGTGNEKPKLMWAKFPIVVESNGGDFSPSDNNSIVAAPAWIGSALPLSLGNGAPIVINDWAYHQGLQHIAEIRMKLGYYDILKRFHSGSRSYTLFKTSFIQDYANDGKFLKCFRDGSHMEVVWESLESSLFEVYIDRVDSSNNRNVNYNDIVAAFNSGKIVYVKEHTNVNDRDFVYFIETCDTVNGTVDFHCLGYFETRACRITDSNSYSFNDYYLFTETADIDESVTPPNTNNVNFDKLKTVYNKAQQVDIILIYTNSSGNKYKLPAVKLTATEIMFSVYDPDTARNLSVIINDQNQYTVIT